ncbi:hemin-degrading factor [Rhizobium laguerreae]|jgi:putative hemin transport protein|uniref:Hemin transport protein n=1 Tax=Rhizobium laguerreae TaxID=1076926 RepID=A0AAJ3A929_9HYPH|nr:ChuX/HutX family heme-like substrate-binding protein [Rhizobium laguerreae]MBY3240333.1 hemin-degrading factor [Rhizobium laguerreae]MBY3272678.1 hemin-degrading factor [Rhizobium laguerreae]MBY3303972.1 hemin-degrading factor [Rhizobium laguerreae]MBY3309460.1 hemin-degrading factor [Rhizobium laguerreae]MBY3489762.1 hemin-degrading factor [Rhizobium laguerreae]
MTEQTRPAPAEIRAFRAENPKMRERDIAAQLKISEAALVAAETGISVTRIDGSALRLLEHVAGLGEVMALSRNESAVHEKIGVFENIKSGAQAAIVLGENIDLRIFPSRWEHGFAVSKKDGDQERLSLQYFDKAGNAVHKVHLRPSSNVEAYHAIVAELKLEDQSQEFVEAETSNAVDETADVNRDELRDNWSKLTDTHEFFGMLKRLKIGRQAAVRTVGDDYAWKLDNSATADMMHASVKSGLPIMCFVANNGIVQIHSGPIFNVQPMGPWINIMDPTFHLHLRQDHIAETWAVRKPTTDGHVTSLEAYNAEGEMIIQFFGKRKEGSDERAEWREIVENLPRAASVAA